MRYLWFILGVVAVSSFYIWRICRAARRVCGTCVQFVRSSTGTSYCNNIERDADEAGCAGWRARKPQACSCDVCAEAQAKGEGRK